MTFWEAEVGENDLEEVLFELLSGFNTIAGLNHVVPLLAEEIGEVLAEETVMLGDEDCAHASGPITMGSRVDFFLWSGIESRDRSGTCLRALSRVQPVYDADTRRSGRNVYSDPLL